MQDNWKFDLRKNSSKNLQQEHLDESEKFKNWNLRNRRRHKFLVRLAWRCLMLLALLLPVVAVLLWLL